MNDQTSPGVCLDFYNPANGAAFVSDRLPRGIRRSLSARGLRGYRREGRFPENPGPSRVGLRVAADLYSVLSLR